MFPHRVSPKTIAIFIVLNLIPLGFLVLVTIGVVELWRKKKLKLQILGILRENPNGITASEIGDCARVSLEMAYLALDALVGKNLVKSEMKRCRCSGLRNSYTITTFGVEFLRKK